MKLNNLTMSSTKAFTFVPHAQSVTDLLQAGWDVRFDYLLIPPLTDPILVQIPGFTALVQNGSASTVKWPVTGAFSKWNALEWPFEVVGSGIDLIDKFQGLQYTGHGDWTYISELPIHFEETTAYFKAGSYDLANKVGMQFYVDLDGYVFDDRNYLRSFGPGKGQVIKFCPPFVLPKRIQLRITLVRVQEN